MDWFDKAIEQELAKHEVNTRLKTAPVPFARLWVKNSTFED
jgi:hypothetical protein